MESDQETTTATYSSVCLNIGPEIKWDLAPRLFNLAIFFFFSNDPRCGAVSPCVSGVIDKTDTPTTTARDN